MFMEKEFCLVQGWAMPRAIVIGLACLLMLSTSSRTQGAPANLSPEEKVDNIFKSFHKDTPGCAVAVIKNGTIIFKRGYGMADLDHDVAITPTTVFHAASLTK